MDKLFLKIYDTFNTNSGVFTDAGLKPIMHIDRFRGQPLNPEQFEYYELPALFLDYKITWSRAGKAYNGIGRLDVHVVLEPTWPTDNLAAAGSEGLKHLWYYALIRQLLDDLQSENTGKLIRVDENPVDTGVTIYHLMSYEFPYYDPCIPGVPTVDVLPEELLLYGQLVKKLKE